jgi:ATP-dependent RNA helicase DeaD
MQVAQHIGWFGKFTKLRVAPIFGGEPIDRQIRALKDGVHIVVGTPGRVIDLLERRVLNLQSVRVVVLDEADRMLDMGFIDDIEYILSRTPRDRQTSLFSATIDHTVMNVCNKYMRNPEKVLVSKDEIALTQMTQYYMVVNPRYKFEAVCKILDGNNIDRAIVFCRTRTETTILAEKLRKRGHDARALHAGYSQPQRDAVMNSFRKGKLKLLVATDVAARGLDIQEITHIINYDVPLDALVYFHRIGRTARKGSGGTAITLVDYGELADFNNIKALTKTTIEELPSLSNDSPIQEFR